MGTDIILLHIIPVELQNCSSLSLYVEMYGGYQTTVDLLLCQLGYRLLLMFAVPDLECCIDEW